MTSEERVPSCVICLPEDVATTLLRALVWCGDQITTEQREQAWAWVEGQRGNVEEMGQ